MKAETAGLGKGEVWLLKSYVSCNKETKEIGDTEWGLWSTPAPSSFPGPHEWCIDTCSSEGLSHCVKGNVICDSVWKVLKLRKTQMGCDVRTEAGIKSKHIGGVFAEESPVWALTASLGSRPGMLRGKFISALGKIHLLIQKQLPSGLWYMTAGRNFLLKSVLQMQALTGLVKEVGGGKVNEDVETCEMRGRRSEGRSYEEN